MIAPAVDRGAGPPAAPPSPRIPSPRVPSPRTPTRAPTGPDPADVPAAVAGDPDALARLLRAVTPLVLRYCRVRLPADGPESAEDVTQDVCVALLLALPRYTDRGLPFMAFAYRIAANHVVDVHRRTARARRPAPPSPAQPAPPADVLAGLDGEPALRHALDRLPPGPRTVLVLRVGFGLPVDRVAAVLGMSAGAVRVAQHRALARLRSEYERPAGS